MTIFLMLPTWLLLQSKVLADTSSKVSVTVIRDPEACLFAHNAIRSKWHNTAVLDWDDDLAYNAEKWAIHLALGNMKLTHSMPPGSMIDENNERYGENLYLMEGSILQRCRDAVLFWYMERKTTNYDFNNIVYNNNAGHMQQLLWIPTSRFGVGITTAFGKTWIVAQYKPPGNSQTDNLNKFINKPVKAGYPTLSDLTSASNSKEVSFVLNLPPASPVPECKDEISYCYQYPGCQDSVKNWCKKSCKLCKPGSKVDGGWTEWTKISECSDDNKYEEVRYCMNPVPREGGRDCVGDDQRYHTCSNCECDDVIDTCNQYKRAGYCEKTIDWAKINCCKTCFCDSSETVCQNYHDDCNAFASRGDCGSPQFTTWMQANCAKACQFC
ncbi:ectin [Hydra vulgaris]|uniref:Ectin n=1 Tax=Hydra vulgaris TaxID=6087 RepID=A0ABM4B4V5_HYDVU